MPFVLFHPTVHLVQQPEPCDRFEDREIYLDLLGDVKGGMTRLVYEQDDDFLLHGVYERFRADIENAGYLINDKKTEISNSKFDALKGFINKNPNKSYIIFCNYKYPADNIYIKFVDRKNELENMENTIIAKKYGGDNFAVYPTDNTVTKDNIFDYLIGNIQQGKRVIFITTGASGGTGLNLGNFNGVINYELPFTCIELEQRFGRVDRMNSNAESKDMIFILNKDSNPMLRYSALKINATCTYMPIRNTVLFYPAFINANIDSLKKELDSCKISDEENETIYNITVERNKYPNKENEIKAIEEYLLKKRSLDNYDKDVDDIRLR